MVLVASATPASAQVFAADAYVVAVTNRNPGGAIDAPARGIGAGAAVHAQVGRFGGTLSGIYAPTSLEGQEASQDLAQIAVRGRVAIIPQLAVEASITRRSLDPDFAGTEVGFISAGLHANLPVSTWGRFWGR